MQPQQPHENKRHQERFPMEVPVMLEGGVGTSRNISESGIFFVTDKPLVEGGDLRFSVKLNHVRPGKPVRLDCQGQVLRVERTGENFGVAATINQLWCVH